jgi:hypothetical protein
MGRLAFQDSLLRRPPAEWMFFWGSLSTEATNANLSLKYATNRDSGILVGNICTHFRQAWPNQTSAARNRRRRLMASAFKNKIIRRAHKNILDGPNCPLNNLRRI